MHPERIAFALCEGEAGCVNEKKGEEEEDERACVDVYEYPSLELKKTLRGGAKSKYVLAKFSPDGTMLATVSSEPDYFLTIWDWENESLFYVAKHSLRKFSVYLSRHSYMVS